MRQCFEGINVHGLPMLSIPEGESVDYPFLNGRFKDGLAAISNSIAQRLDTPRQVTVAGKNKNKLRSVLNDYLHLQICVPVRDIKKTKSPIHEFKVLHKGQMRYLSALGF